MENKIYIFIFVYCFCGPRYCRWFFGPHAYINPLSKAHFHFYFLVFFEAPFLRPAIRIASFSLYMYINILDITTNFSLINHRILIGFFSWNRLYFRWFFVELVVFSVIVVDLFGGFGCIFVSFLGFLLELAAVFSRIFVDFSWNRLYFSLIVHRIGCIFGNRRWIFVDLVVFSFMFLDFEWNLLYSRDCSLIFHGIYCIFIDFLLNWRYFL